MATKIPLTTGYNELLDGTQFHNDDVHDAGMALNAVRYISIDYDAVAARNRGYIQENITRRKEYEEKQTREER